MRLINVVTACLYGSFDSDIYMKFLKDLRYLNIKFKTQKVIFDQITKIIKWVKAIRAHVV